MDIDGVLADFISPFLRTLEERTGSDPIDPQLVTDPNFINHPWISEQVVTECIQEVSNNPKFWEGLEPLASAKHWQALDQLSRDERLVFVTHRYERPTYDIGQVTCAWLRKHGVSKPVVYFTQTYKSELIQKLHIELFVDDRHENCRDVAENTAATVLMPHRSYNQTFSHPRVRRIQALDEVFDYLESAKPI